MKVKQKFCNYIIWVLINYFIVLKSNSIALTLSNLQTNKKIKYKDAWRTITKTNKKHAFSVLLYRRMYAIFTQFLLCHLLLHNIVKLLCDLYLYLYLNYAFSKPCFLGAGVLGEANQDQELYQQNTSHVVKEFV